jgi:hypothetical protein
MEFNIEWLKEGLINLILDLFLQLYFQSSLFRSISFYFFSFVLGFVFGHHNIHFFKDLLSSAQILLKFDNKNHSTDKGSHFSGASRRMAAVLWMNAKKITKTNLETFSNLGNAIPTAEINHTPKIILNKHPSVVMALLFQERKVIPDGSFSGFNITAQMMFIP